MGMAKRILSYHDHEETTSRLCGSYNHGPYLWREIEISDFFTLSFATRQLDLMTLRGEKFFRQFSFVWQTLHELDGEERSLAMTERVPQPSTSVVRWTDVTLDYEKWATICEDTPNSKASGAFKTRQAAIFQRLAHWPFFLCYWTGIKMVDVTARYSIEYFLFGRHFDSA